MILKIGSPWVLEEYEIVKTRLEKYICHPDWIVVESFADWTWQELIWHEIDFLYIDISLVWKEITSSIFQVEISHSENAEEKFPSSEYPTQMQNRCIYQNILNAFLYRLVQMVQSIFGPTLLLPAPLSHRQI